MSITPAEVVALLRQGRFSLAAEADCQADIQAFLADRLPAGCALSREHRLGPGERPDFMVDGRIVIEVKIKGAVRAAIGRQLLRYAKHADVEAMILASNVSMALPPLIGGKPVAVVSLGRAWM